MATGNRIYVIVLCVWALALVSCTNRKSTVEDGEFKPISPAVLEEGDIVFRKCNGVISMLIAEQQKEKLYSHAGLIHFRNDSCFVVHAEVFDDADESDIHCQYLSQFMEETINWAVYRLDTTQTVRDRLAKEALRYREKKVKFNKQFRMSKNNNTVYCTQLIALVVNEIYGSELMNASSTLTGTSVFRVDDIYQISQIRLIDRYLGEVYE